MIISFTLETHIETLQTHPNRILLAYNLLVKKVIKLVYRPNESIIADIMTKPLQGSLPPKGSIPLGPGLDTRSSHHASPENPGRAKGASQISDSYFTSRNLGNSKSDSDFDSEILRTV